VRHHGRAIVYAAAAWGAFIALAGFAHEAGLAVVLVALAGAADMVSGGILCVIGCGACALALPALWIYEAPGRSPKVLDESSV
jgi:hypothetical protein